MTPKDQPPGSGGVQYATGKEQKTTTNSSRQDEVAGPQWKRVQLWMCLVVKVKSDACKNSVAFQLIRYFSTKVKNNLKK